MIENGTAGNVRKKERHFLKPGMDENRQRKGDLFCKKRNSI